MSRLSLLTAGVIAFGFVSSPTLAASRTFVSGAGVDSGSCGLAAPCRTFAYALTQTSPSGEIIVLSSAGYGAVTIAQSVSIINTSNFAGVTVASGNGITINAGATDSVILRGLTIDGGGTGSNGIVFNSGGKLTIDQCNVMNFVGSGSTGNGIFLTPSSGNQNIIITNTTAANNQYVGVFYLPGGNATAGIVIDHVSANNNQLNGIQLNNSTSSGFAQASVSNSSASFNTNNGFYFSTLNVSLDASYASNNGADGVLTDNFALLSIGRSVLYNNGQFGLHVAGGTTSTFRDNRGGVSGTVNPISTF